MKYREILRAASKVLINIKFTANETSGEGKMKKCENLCKMVHRTTWFDMFDELCTLTIEKMLMTY